VEYGDQCFCGEKAPPSSLKVADSQCGMTCAGKGSEKCGGDYTMQVYTFSCSGTPEPLPPSKTVRETGS
jgi:hypothetical protein